MLVLGLSVLSWKIIGTNIMKRIKRSITIKVVRFSYCFNRMISSIVSIRLLANRINKMSLEDNFSKGMLPLCTKAGGSEPLRCCPHLQPHSLLVGLIVFRLTDVVLNSVYYRGVKLKRQLGPNKKFLTWGGPQKKIHRNKYFYLKGSTKQSYPK